MFAVLALYSVLRESMASCLHTSPGLGISSFEAAVCCMRCDTQCVMSWRESSVNHLPHGILKVPVALRGPSAPWVLGEVSKFWERIGGNFQTGWLDPYPNRAPGAYFSVKPRGFSS